MYYYRLRFDFPLMPKPRGKLTKDGRIYHNDKPYRDYTNTIIEHAKPFVIERMGDRIRTRYCVGLFNGYMQTRGAQPDIDNLIGSVLDSLKKGGLIYDDNRKYWEGVYIKAYELPINANLFILCDPIMEDRMIDEVRQVYRKAKAIKLEASTK